jgi:hypothetical protein
MEETRGIDLVRSTLPNLSDENPDNHSKVDEDEMALLVMFVMECSPSGARAVIAELKPHVLNADVRPAAGCTALSVLEECTKHGGIEFRSEFKVDKWAKRIEQIVTNTVKQEVRQHFCNTLNGWCDMIESTNGWGNEAGIESTPMSATAAQLNALGIGISWRDRMNQRHGFSQLHQTPKKGESSVQTRVGEDDYEFAAARVDDEAFGIGGGGGAAGGDEAMAWSLHNQQAEMPQIVIVNDQEEKDAAFARALQVPLVSIPGSNACLVQ